MFMRVGKDWLNGFGHLCCNTHFKLTASFLKFLLILIILTALSPVSAMAQVELTTNGDFESGLAGWTNSGGAVITNYASYYHSPTHYLWLGGAKNEKDAAYQQIAIPSGASAATLSFYYNIYSLETTSGIFDTFNVTIRNTSGAVLSQVANLSNNNKDPAAGNPNYHQITFPLSSYINQTIRIYFVSTNDSSNPTDFRVDDVSVLATFPITVQTFNATSVTNTWAVFNGSINANGQNALTYFEWGTTASYGNTTSVATFGSGMTTPVSFSYTNTGLLPNTQYHYRIVSYNTVTTNRGGDAYFTTLFTTPVAPSGLTVSNAANGVSLSWQDNSSNENGFYIQRRQGSTYTYFSVAANQTNYTDTSVLPSVQYCYTVSATNSSGNSAQTSEQCATYTASGPAPIAIIAGDLTPVTGARTYYGGYSVGTGLQYSWSTSDGQRSTASNPQFQFNSPQLYSISLTVTDSANRTSTASIQINVQASNSGTTTFVVSIGADPVVLATGNYIQNRVDLQMPGKGFPFEFRRFYNSKFSDQTGLPLGFGWTFNYNERLVATGTNVLVIQGDGSTWTFFPTNNGYVGEPGIYDSLATNSDSTWTLTDKNQTATVFDANGRLVSIADKNANMLTCSYGGGILSQIIDTAGRTNFFSTNALGCISAITDPIGRTIQFQYDSLTNLVAVVDANNQTNQYFYDGNHQMTSACDAKGTFYIYNEYDQTNFVVVRQHDAFTNWTYFAYDFTNRITYVTNAFGKVSTHYFDDRLLETNTIDEMGDQQIFQYDTNRNRIFIQDKNGNQTQYGYDLLGNVTNKQDALGNVTTIQYDGRNNPVLRVDALTNATTFGYDSNGNLTAVTNALGYVNGVKYDLNGLPLVLTDARGFSTTNQYDPLGNLTAVTDARGFTSHFVHDSVGRKVYQMDALIHTNSFVYDNNNNLLSTTNALGFVTTYAYDANNNRITTQNARGATITNVFDLKDRLVAVLAPLGMTNGTLYDALDRKIASFDALGNRTSYAYDDVGNMIAVTNALNQATRFTFDAQGNQTSIIDPTGHYVTNIFDALNRKITTIDTFISTNTTAYDALGRASATTNADGQLTQYFYDAIGRLTNVIDAASQSVFFAYDPNGNRFLTTDPNGHSWTNVLNELNQVVEQDDPQGHKTLFGYDSVGNLTNKITANNINIVYKYDAANQLTNIIYPSGAPVTFTYDPVGNRTRMTDSLGTTIWGYDSLNRMMNVANPYGQNVNNGYDANGNRHTLIYPGGKTVHYTFDSLNRMSSFTDWLNAKYTYIYDSRGNVTTTTNANGTKTIYGHDVANRLVGLTNYTSTGSVIAGYAVTLDGVGNYRQSTHSQPLFPILSNQTNNYGYDFDNRLVSFDGQTVTNNANGDLTTFGTNSYVYDYEDRLVQILPTNTSSTFGYDGLGNRITRTINGKPRNFALDRMGALTQVLLEADFTNGPVAYYVYGLGLAEKIASSGEITTYHFNIQGSTVALTDSTGKITDSYAYDSFGVLANSDGYSSQPFRYLGRYGIVDEGTGLLYARARHFSPQLGRFLTKDPVTGKDSDGQSLNRYVYALNNPFLFSDVSGLCPQGGNIWSTLNCSLHNLIVPEQAEVLATTTANSTPLTAQADWVTKIVDQILLNVVGVASVIIQPEGPGEVAEYGVLEMDGVVATDAVETGGTGAAYNKATGQGLYVLRDEAGDIRYIGRGDAPARIIAHMTTPGKSDLFGEALWDNNLLDSQAKGLEQKLMDALGGAKSQNPNSPLLNIIRSFSPSNPNASLYQNAVSDDLWSQTLEKLGQ